jgi:DNA repair protein SbcD/Mre11
MKFAHLADIHLGSWREPKMREVSVQSFILAMDTAFREKVDFILVSGDLFHTAVPSIDNLRLAVKKFKEAKVRDIPIYIIAGSHDYSPAGKTMIDVLEEAGLVANVMQGRVDAAGMLILDFTVDKKTGAKITGLIGRKGMLDRHYYEQLDTACLEKEQGFKIFLFHTALEELRPAELREMDASPVSLLPKGFDYYAGGHVHIVRKADLPGYKNIVYPGPAFPANFSELEKLGSGSMVIYDSIPRIVHLQARKTLAVAVDAGQKTKEEMMQDLAAKTAGHDDAIVLVRLAGTIKNALPSDITVRDITALFPKAYAVLVNKAKLVSESFTDIAIETNAEEAEQAIIKEHLSHSTIDFGGQEEQVITQLIKVLSTEKGEGEKVGDYNAKIKRMAEDVLRL